MTSSVHYGGLQLSVKQMKWESTSEVWDHGPQLKQWGCAHFVLGASNGRVERDIDRQIDMATAVMWMLYWSVVAKNLFPTHHLWLWGLGIAQKDTAEISFL